MILFKIPETVYQDIMAHFHHDMPLEEATKIKLQAEQVVGRDSNGKSLGQIEGDGLGNIDRPKPAPHFD